MLFTEYHKLLNQAKDPTIETDSSGSETPSHNLDKNSTDNAEDDNENVNEADDDHVENNKISEILLLPNYLLLKKNLIMNNSGSMMKLNM